MKHRHAMLLNINEQRIVTSNSDPFSIQVLRYLDAFSCVFTDIQLARVKMIDGLNF